jgi:hypothetical protein
VKNKVLLKETALNDKKQPYLLILTIVLCALTGTLINCSKKEPQRRVDEVGNPIDEVFNRTKDVLRDVAQGINNAVY